MSFGIVYCSLLLFMEMNTKTCMEQLQA